MHFICIARTHGTSTNPGLAGWQACCCAHIGCGVADKKQLALNASTRTCAQFQMNRLCAPQKPNARVRACVNPCVRALLNNPETHRRRPRRTYTRMHMCAHYAGHVWRCTCVALCTRMCAHMRTLLVIPQRVGSSDSRQVCVCACSHTHNQDDLYNNAILLSAAC